MKSRKIIILILLFIAVVIFIIILMLNPNISDKDFDLMYRIGQGEKSYKDGRNMDIKDSDFSFNEESYFNIKLNTKLTIHSLNIVKGNEEKVIFVLDDIKNNEHPSIYIDQMNRENHRFSGSEIKFKNDSVYVWKSWNNKEKEFFFKGKRIPTSVDE
jgi:hypothetical protein